MLTPRSASATPVPGRTSSARSLRHIRGVVAVAGVAVELRLDIVIGDVGNASFDAGQLLVVTPPLVGVRLGQRCEVGGSVGMAAAQDGETGLGLGEGGGGGGRPVGVEFERRSVGLARLEAIQRPVAALDSVLLMA